MSKPRSSLAKVFVMEDGRNVSVTFSLVSALFLLWGLCNGMIDVMDKHFQDQLHLTKAQSAWVQTAHYLGYALMALPAGLIARTVGYRGGIIAGLIFVSAGGFWFIAATRIVAFWAYLLGICVIAAGLTVLETVANPYTTVLGPREYSALRINLAQTLNGVGWMLGPLVGAAFFYSADGVDASNADLSIPYVTIAILVLVFAAIFTRAYIPDVVPGPVFSHQSSRVSTQLWMRPHFLGGVLAEFLYVAAQAGIFSFFINYMVSEVPTLSHGLATSGLLKGGTTMRQGWVVINEQGAARLQGLVGFGLFLLGRLTGTVLLTRIAPHRLLGTYSLINVVLCAIVVMKMGWLSVAAVLLSFFFMSISFPTIFALGVSDLGSQTKKASALIVMAIVGGAIMPKVMGYLGDVYDMSVAFLMPLVCFAGIAIYGYAWRAMVRAGTTAVPKPI